VLPALLFASFGPTAFAEAEPPKPASAPVVDKERLFPGNRGAQRMTNVAGERRSLATWIAESAPDWAEWWSTEEVMLSLGIPEERAAAVEALLGVRKQARITAIAACETSEAGVKFAEAARAAGAEDPGAKPPLEVRAEIALLGARAALPAFDAIKEADRGFADGCARLEMPDTQPEPDDATLERMRHGVGRLRGFDPALSRMKLLNTGVELAIHAAPLLEQAGESRQAIADEVAAWQQAVAPLLEAFERQRAEAVAASASGQSLQQRIRRLRGASDLEASIHAELVSTSIKSARVIAAIVSGSDPDRAIAWLRSVYHALSPANLGPTSGDAALEEAARIAAGSGEEGKEWAVALASVRSENLRICAELEGQLIEASVRAIGDRGKLAEVLLESGPVFEVNRRRVTQAESMVRRVIGISPVAATLRIRHVVEVARAQTRHHLPNP
jgi:hypothetical protein